MKYCCNKFQENYEYGKIQDDFDDDAETLNGKYATMCCCGPKSAGGILIVREIEYCPFCGSKLNNINQ